MASCKDCVHVEACFRQKKIIIDIINHAAQFAEKFTNEKIKVGCCKHENFCELFCDRSQFVELPRVGDKVYELCRINQFGDYKIDELEIRGFIVDTSGTAFDYELLGERFFLTREEAEQALKEREENAN